MQKSSIYLILIIVSILFSDCKDDNDYNPVPTEELLVSFSIELPADPRSSKFAPRSIEDSDEETVVNINILAFVKDSQGTHRYAYSSQGRNYTSNADENSFIAPLKKYPQEQIFVILMNASSELQQLTILPEETLETVLSKLICKHSQEWPAKINGATEFKPIPMYATSESLVITPDTKTIGVYDLVRMLARIDVGVNASVTNFQLTKAAIFNRKTCGYIPFKAANWDNTNKEVIRADVPALNPGGGDLTIKIPSVIYEADAVSHAISKSIYTFEAKGVNNKNDATAIVVGGYFNYPQNQTIESWYRIDIPPTQANYVSGDILRNFIYDIKIKSVAAQGASSPESAFDDVPSITVSVFPWNMATNNTIFDGQYKLTLTEDRIISYGSAILSSVDIVTDYPGGIIVGEIVYTFGEAGWLTVSGGNNGELQRTLHIEAGLNNTDVDRSAEFDITAGNMVYTFSIEQFALLP